MSHCVNEHSSPWYAAYTSMKNDIGETTMGRYTNEPPKPQPGEVPNSLREIGSRLHRLSYRDMDTLVRELNSRMPVLTGSTTLARTLLDIADQFDPA